MKKRIITGILAAIVLVMLLMGCQKKESSFKLLKVAATAVPHAEILERVQYELSRDGIELDIIVMDDYNTPNRALADKEVDANFFQHIPFMEDQMEQFGYSLESIATIHYEPMGLYSKKYRSFVDVPEGALIAVPSDPTNQARALILLEKQGLIELTRHDTKATIFNLQSNPKHFRVIEADSPMLVRMLDDVDLAAITTNFALQASLSPMRDALALEDKNSPFANVLTIRKGDRNPSLTALKAALQSDRVRAFILGRYEGAVLPTF